MNPKESYHDQIEKWNKIYLHHNAAKIVEYENSNHESKDPLKVSFLSPSKLNSSSLLEDEDSTVRRNGDIKTLKEEQFKALKHQLLQDLESTDWFYGIPNSRIGQPQAVFTKGNR